MEREKIDDGCRKETSTWKRKILGWLVVIQFSIHVDHREGKHLPMGGGGGGWGQSPPALSTGVGKLNTAETGSSV